MRTGGKHIRHGIGSVRPFIFGHRDLPEFVKDVFGAEELERLTSGAGLHVESRIGDSVIVMAASDPPFPGAIPNSIYVYVEDVDAAYARAIKAGATSISAPENKPYQERGCGVKDRYGNIWYIATYTG